MNVWLDQDEVSYLVGGENARVKLKDISDEDIQPVLFLTSPYLTFPYLTLPPHRRGHPPVTLSK